MRDTSIKNIDRRTRFLRRVRFAGRFAWCGILVFAFSYCLGSCMTWSAHGDPSIRVNYPALAKLISVTVIAAYTWWLWFGEEAPEKDDDDY